MMFNIAPQQKPHTHSGKTLYRYWLSVFSFSLKRLRRSFYQLLLSILSASLSLFQHKIRSNKGKQHAARQRPLQFIPWCFLVRLKQMVIIMEKIIIYGLEERMVCNHQHISLSFGRSRAFSILILINFTSIYLVFVSFVRKYPKQKLCPVVWIL